MSHTLLYPIYFSQLPANTDTQGLLEICAQTSAALPPGLHLKVEKSYRQGTTFRVHGSELIRRVMVKRYKDALIFFIKAFRPWADERQVADQNPEIDAVCAEAARQILVRARRRKKSPPDVQKPSHPMVSFTQFFAETRVNSHLACLRDYIDMWFMDNVPEDQPQDTMPMGYNLSTTREEPEHFAAELAPNAVCEVAVLHFLRDGVEFVFSGPRVNNPSCYTILQEIGCLLANAYLGKFYSEAYDQEAHRVLN